MRPEWRGHLCAGLMKALQRREKSGGLYQITGRSHREALLYLSRQSLFSFFLSLFSGATQQDSPLISTYSAAPLLRVKLGRNKKKKRKQKHLVYVQLFHIRAKEMKEMRVSESRTRACRKISMLGFGVSLSLSPSSSQHSF